MNLNCVISHWFYDLIKVSVLLAPWLEIKVKYFIRKENILEKRKGNKIQRGEIKIRRK